MDGPRFRRAVREALATLAGHGGLPLPRLRDALPPELFTAICESALEPVDPATAYLRVAAAARMHVGISMEVVRAVLAELSVCVGTEGRSELRDVLPHEWAELLVEPHRADAGGSSD